MSPEEKPNSKKIFGFAIKISAHKSLNLVFLTKHIEQVSSMLSLTESKSSKDRDGFLLSNTGENPSNGTGAVPISALDCFQFMWKAMSSYSHGD